MDGDAGQSPSLPSEDQAQLSPLQHDFQVTPARSTSHTSRPLNTMPEALKGAAGGLSSWLLSTEPIAIGIFVTYFALIAGVSYLVWQSISDTAKLEDLFSGRPFLFLRIAVGALGCTWYFMIDYMRWSYNNYASSQGSATVGTWLQNTALFEEAWGIVCGTPISWWWSSWICIWSVILTFIIYRESPRRGIKYPWAYLVLGMLVAISVSTALFLAAVYLHPRKSAKQVEYSVRGSLSLYVCLFLAFYTIYLIPSVTGTPQFLPTLLAMHVVLLLPFIPLGKPNKPILALDDAEAERQVKKADQHDSELKTLFGVVTTMFFTRHTAPILPLPPGKGDPHWIFKQAFTHPAQASISMDVLWSAFTVGLWYVVGGSFTATVFKSIVIALVGLWGALKKYGINWTLLASVVPVTTLLGVGVAYLALARARGKNTEKRRKLMEELGLKENVVIPGTKETAPTKAGRKLVVGFWHPYCNAGGGGERVLWSAIAYTQRTQPEAVCLVYSGDYPLASKEMILSKAKDRFSIDINPKLVKFIPLRSRYLISDNYWRFFTLLGQSFGSVCLAWEGLAGKDGLWGDIFIDTMGHAFTYPFVRAFAGGEIVIAAYTHYPTVSADMVRRVKSRESGVESGGRRSGWLISQVKLVYYSIFTALYATSLLFAESIMTNSTWTQNHIQTLLSSAKKSTLASLLLMDEVTERKNVERGDKVDKKDCKVVYPPCDVQSLVASDLSDRGRGIVSLAQFRPEKEHSKQLYALAELFKLHPAYREGQGKVSLTLMGGVRDAGDQTRLDKLNKLVIELGIQDNVEFVVNAPYSEIVERLGNATIGLNTMQDEHFGINVVEFMAAGLVPIVHASAGPKMDIVIPHGGEQTGYHATTPVEFAQAIHTALSLPEADQVRMRTAARMSAKDRFSQEEFEKGWEAVWSQLTRRVNERVED